MTDYKTDNRTGHTLQMNAEGKYVWVYELPMQKSFFLLFEVWKVLGIGAAAVIILLAVINLIDGSGIGGMVAAIGTGAVCFALLMLLSIPAYYIVTRANNGMYTVLFEMDEAGVDHIQLKTDKAKALEALTVFAGMRTGSRTTAGAGVLSAAGGTLYSAFSNVKSVRAVRGKNLIILKGKLIRNQVYADDENFDFVLDYIVRHCPAVSFTQNGDTTL